MNDSNSAYKKPLSPEQAYYKITAFCTFRDRSRKEVLTKLYALGVSKDIAKNIISKLEEEGYLNEERMAHSYAGGKFRVKSWGKKKIALHMKHLGLEEELIVKGIEDINQDDYLSKLEDLFEKKWKSLKEEDPQKKLGKVIRFLAGKGYEPELIWNLVRKQNLGTEED